MTRIDPPPRGAGEQIARRANQQRLKRVVASVTLLIALAMSGPNIESLGVLVAPADKATDAGSLIWAIIFIVAIGGISVILWSEFDEVRRKVIINAAAISGIVSLSMIFLTQAAGNIVTLEDPFFLILLLALATMFVAIIAQNVRDWTNS